MCFDTETSLLAWSLSYSIAFFLYFRNRGYDRWNAAFIISFATIQLLEAGLWSNLENPDINSLFTRLVLLVLLTQPLVQTFMGYKSTKSELLFYSSIVFCIILIYGLYRITQGTFTSTIGPNGHLVWTSSEYPSNFLGPSWVTILYLLGLMVPLLFMKEYRGIPLLLVGLGTFAYNLKYSSSGEFGSMWCFSAVIYSILALFVN